MSNLIIENSVNYEFIATADGSPSICLSSDLIRPEAMHHRQGALAESIYIYLSALNESLQLTPQPKILSVGLGCAYNEMLSVGQLLKNESKFDSFYMESFESDDSIRNTFLTWLMCETSQTEDGSELQTRLFQTFNHVLNLVENYFELPSGQLKETLRALNVEQKWILRSKLDATTVFKERFSVIFFDAFSNQATPEIWTEEFLTSFLNQASAAACVLATYAATGGLNRSLRNAGFIRVEFSGFSGKRQSTRAIRNTNPMPL